MIPKEIKDELMKVAKSKGIDVRLKIVGENDQIPFALAEKIKNNKFQICVKENKNLAPEYWRKFLFHELGHCVFFKNYKEIDDIEWKRKNLLGFCRKNTKYFKNSFLVCYEAIELFLEIIQEIFAERFYVKYSKEYSVITESDEKKFVEKLSKLSKKEKVHYFEDMILKRYKKWTIVTFIKDMATWARFIIMCSDFPKVYGCKETLSLFPKKFIRNMVKLGKIMKKEKNLIDGLEKSKKYLKNIMKITFDVIRKRKNLNDDEIIREFYARAYSPKKKQIMKKDKFIEMFILKTEFEISLS